MNERTINPLRLKTYCALSKEFGIDSLIKWKCKIPKKYDWDEWYALYVSVYPINYNEDTGKINFVIMNPYNTHRNDYSIPEYRDNYFTLSVDKLEPEEESQVIDDLCILNELYNNDLYDY